MDYHILFAFLFIGGLIILVILFPALLGKGWRMERIGFGVFGGRTGKDRDGGADGDGGD